MKWRIYFTNGTTLVVTAPNRRRAAGKARRQFPRLDISRIEASATTTPNHAR